MMNKGGGGNLGYFMRQEPDEEIKFVDNQGEDSFEKTLDEKVETDTYISLFDRLKKLFRKIRLAIAKFIIKQKNKN